MGEMVDLAAYRQYKRLRIARANMRAGLEPSLVMDEDGWPADDYMDPEPPITDDEMAAALRAIERDRLG